MFIKNFSYIASYSLYKSFTKRLSNYITFLISIFHLDMSSFQCHLSNLQQSLRYITFHLYILICDCHGIVHLSIHEHEIDHPDRKFPLIHKFCLPSIILWNFVSLVVQGLLILILLQYELTFIFWTIFRYLSANMFFYTILYRLQNRLWIRNLHL